MRRRERIAPSLRVGDHLAVRRLLGAYTHHGVYVGDGKVVHFDGEPLRGRDAAIRLVDLHVFERGARSRVVDAASPLDPAAVLERAFEALGEGWGPYRLLVRNCEHFATWCRRGEVRSRQVRRGVASTLVVAGVTTAALWWNRPEPEESPT